MRKKILVIEDERSVRRTVIKLLDTEGFEVIGAENGNIGVELARTENPDLILCDIMMPDLDGYEVLTILQEDPATGMIPVICLTAREERADLRRAMELGANDYLTKPFTREELIGAIATQLGKQERLKQQQTTAVQEAIAQLNNLVYYDSLTNLPNRLLLRERFHQALTNELAANQFIPVAVLSIDQLNDFQNTLGTDYTDLLLQDITERILPYVSEQGTVARLNSEQLALIFPPVQQKQEAQEKARAILDTLTDPFNLIKYEVAITSSLGIALYPEDSQEIDSLLKAANAAMHQAKHKGGNLYQFYTPAILAKSYDRLMLEMNLRHAIDRDEFHLRYQPQIDLQTGKIVAAEALCRWQHPERGMVSPTEFIPLAEETGLIIRLDEWVLRTACQQAKLWAQAGYSISVAVNLSGIQFNQRGLSQRILEILQETQLDPMLLEIELTESAVVQNPEAAIAILTELKSSGIQLSLDDFGTGYSSLSYLRQFPFDRLKIDRSFLRDLTHDSKNAAIITAIIELAHRLNLKVIAEGVETEEQQTFLRHHQCDIMQGYYFSAPVSPDLLVQMLKEVPIENSGVSC